MQLDSSDRVFFRSLNVRGIHAGVGVGNFGEAFTVILGQRNRRSGEGPELQGH